MAHFVFYFLSILLFVPFRFLYFFPVSFFPRPSLYLCMLQSVLNWDCAYNLRLRHTIFFLTLLITARSSTVGCGNTSPTTNLSEFYHLLPTVRIFSYCFKRGMIHIDEETFYFQEGKKTTDLLTLLYRVS